MNCKFLFCLVLGLATSAAFGIESGMVPGNEVGNGGKTKRQFIEQLAKVSESFLGEQPTRFSEQSRVTLGRLKDGGYPQVLVTDAPLRTDEADTVPVQFMPDRESLLLYEPTTQMFEKHDLTMLLRFSSYHAVFQILRSPDQDYALSLRYATAGMKSSEQVYVVSKLYQGAMKILSFVSVLYAHSQLQAVSPEAKAGEITRLLDAQRDHLEYAVASQPAFVYLTGLRDANADAYARAHALTLEIARMSKKLVTSGKAEKAKADDLRDECGKLLLNIETLLRIVSN